MAKPLGERIELISVRLAQLKAQQRLSEQAERARTHRMEKRERAKSLAALLRSADAHRKIALGGVVIAAGADDMDPAELCGVLLDGLSRMNQSPTVRLTLKKRGLEHLEVRKAARDV